MIKFTSIGYDIRMNSADALATVDATSWVQNKGLYSNAKDRLGIEENYFQLLQPKDQSEFKSLKDLVLSDGDATLISIEIPVDLVAIYEKKEAIVANAYFDSDSEWVESGYDVCDINGFFSVLHMNVLENSQKKLFQSDTLLDAYLLSNKANILVPDHAPFIVVKLQKYRR